MGSLNVPPEKLQISDYELIAKYNGSVIKLYGEDTGISADILVEKLKSSSFLDMPPSDFSNMCDYISPTPPIPP